MSNFAWLIKLRKPIHLLVCASLLLESAAASMPFASSRPAQAHASAGISQQVQAPAELPGQVQAAAVARAPVRAATPEPSPSPKTLAGTTQPSRRPETLLDISFQSGPLPPTNSDLPQPSASQPNAAAPSAIQNDVTAQALTGIPLLPGWNLISIPRVMSNTSPAVVLAPIAGQFTRVYAYDGCDAADPWKLYDPANAAASDLTAIDHRIGLWIEVTAAVTLPLSGTVPSTTTMQLCTGWNLPGFPVEQSRPVRNAMASIDGKYTRLFGHNLADTSDPWEVYDVSAPDWANDLQQMQPGRGYWVLASENATLTLANQGAPPIVRLISPDDTSTQISTVTFITDILGTVTSDLLQSWTLSYRPHGEQTRVPFATGITPVTSATLGRLDPTLLVNGIYGIELTATDYFGRSVSTSVDVIVEGEAKMGQLTLSFIDMEVPVAGVPIKVIRTYDSRTRSITRDLGFGWTLQVGAAGRYVNNRKPGDGWLFTSGFLPCQRVSETKSHMTEIRFSDREVYRFALRVQPTGPTVGGCFGTASFAQIGGIPGGTLQVLGNTDVFWQNNTDYVVDLNTLALYEPGNVRLTTLNGRQFDLNLQNGLVRVADLNGNTLSISRSGVTHSSGKSLSFTRDSQGRLIKLTDPLGQDITYTYNSAGDLVSVTDPTNGTFTFSYDASHYLLEIVDSLSNSPLRAEYDAEGRVVALIDANGRRLDLAHNVSSGSTSITDRLGNVTENNYDGAGNLVEVVAPGGLTTVYRYTSQGYIQTKIDPLGNTNSFTYDGRDNLTSLTDPLGNTTRYTYDANGRILTTTDPRGHVITNTYDSRGNLTSATDPMGNRTTYTYDARGNMLTERDPLGCTTSRTYDAHGNLVQKTDGLGNVTGYTYDANGKLLTENLRRTVGGTVITETTTHTYDFAGRQLTRTNPLGHTTRLAYDTNGLPVSETDELGRVTNFTYDELGNLVRKTYPDGTFETFDYDAENRLIRQTDRAGHMTSFGYDAIGRLVGTTYPDSTNTTTTYDAASRPIAMMDERGFVTRYEYDANHRRTKIIDALGNSTTFEYDPSGNLIRITDASGHVTRYEYDGNNRRTKEIYPDGTIQTVTYDDAGRRIAVADPAGQTTRFEYDCLGQLTKAIDAFGHAVSYTYDEAGNRVTQTDANGHTTTFEYDANRRLTRQTLPLGMFETLTYDAVGNLIGNTDFNGQVVTYTYDTNNWLLRKTYANGSSVSFNYTPTGERVSVADSRGVTKYAYDPRDRLTRLIYPDGQSLAYTYDPTGNRTALIAPSGTLTYTFDPLNRLTSVTDPNGGVTTYNYDAVGNQTGMTYPNGTGSRYTYDVLNRLTQVEHQRSDLSVIAGYAYTLGPAGNRTRVVESSGRTVDYTYDAMYQLVSEHITDPLGGTTLISYTYDAAGNRLTRMEGVLTTNYSYDANDRLLTAAGTTYTYDNNGNALSQTQAGVTINYTYDPEDRLVRAQAPTLLVDFQYDADGQRVGSAVGGIEVAYLVDANRDFAQVVEERNVAGALLAHYVHGVDLISQQRAGVTSFYHSDGLGSARALTGPDQEPSDTYTYDAFGLLLQKSGSTVNHYRFAGEQFDPNLGFYYLRARYYDPGTGRFWTRDSFSGDPFDPLSLHKYVYAANNPVNRIDPGGHSTLVATMPGLVMGNVARATSVPNYQAALYTIVPVLATACAVTIAKSIFLAEVNPYLVTLIVGPNSPCSFNRIPTLYVRMSKMPFTAIHVAASQAGGRPTVLHKSSPSTDANRTHARAQCAKHFGTLWAGAWWCDEYPFASTLEGGPPGPANPLGATVSLAPFWEQMSQGGELRWFYSRCAREDHPSINSRFGVVVLPAAHDYKDCW